MWQGEDYAMFSDAGNAAVHGEVERVRSAHVTEAQREAAIRFALEDLADAFPEAADTAVREEAIPAATQSRVAR